MLLGARRNYRRDTAGICPGVGEGGYELNDRDVRIGVHERGSRAAKSKGEESDEEAIIANKAFDISYLVARYEGK